MNIIQDFITPGMRHRPMTYPQSSLYKKTMTPKYITIHNAAWGRDAKALHDYLKSQRCADRPASWHFSVDENEIFQALPLYESGWHAGDNLGPGNTTTIGIEIVDRTMLNKPQDKEVFWRACDNAARLCAHLIKTVPSFHEFPMCLKQHYDWSGKNCPKWIREEPGGWQRFQDLVAKHLGEEQVGTVYRVIVGSYSNIYNAEQRKVEVQKAAPTLNIRIVYNDVGDRYLFRVVAADHKNSDNAEVLKDSLARKGVDSFVAVIRGAPEDLPFPEPDPDPDPEIEPPDPEAPGSEIPSGLMEILRVLYEWLKKFFEKEDD